MDFDILDIGVIVVIVVVGKNEDSREIDWLFRDRVKYRDDSNDVDDESDDGDDCDDRENRDRDTIDCCCCC